MAVREIGAPVTLLGQSQTLSTAQLGLQEVWMDREAVGRDYVPLMFNMEKITDQLKIKGKVTAGMGGGAAWDGKSIPPLTSYSELYDWEATQKRWANAYEEDLDTVEFDTYKQRAERLASFRDTSYHDRQSLCWKFFVDGFSTNGPDGVPLFSDSHPMNGTVQSNLVSGALSSLTLSVAYNKMTTQKGPMGLPQYQKPKYLFVDVSQEMYAKQLIGSGMQTEYGNDSVKNMFPSMGLEVVAFDSAYTGTEDMWLLRGSKIETYWSDTLTLQKLMRMEPNHATRYEQWFTYMNWYRSYKGWVGSVG